MIRKGVSVNVLPVKSFVMDTEESLGGKEMVLQEISSGVLGVLSLEGM